MIINHLCICFPFIKQEENNNKVKLSTFITDLKNNNGRFLFEHFFRVCSVYISKLLLCIRSKQKYSAEIDILIIIIN